MGHLSCRILANSASHIFYSLCVLKVPNKAWIVTQKYLCHLGWADQRSHKCEACFNWMWILQLTEHKFAWTVQDTWSVTIWHGIYAKAASPKNKHTPLTPPPPPLVQRWIEAYAPFFCSAFWTLFCLDYSSHKEQQFFRMLELHTTLLTPDHACELTKKVILTHSDQKTYSSLFLRAFFN